MPTIPQKSSGIKESFFCQSIIISTFLFQPTRFDIPCFGEMEFCQILILMTSLWNWSDAEELTALPFPGNNFSKYNDFAENKNHFMVYSILSV